MDLDDHDSDLAESQSSNYLKMSMNTRSGILSGGNWIVDKLKVVDTYPQQDALANILGEAVGNGGSPFNILVDLAKFGSGLPLAGIGLIGADPSGEWIAGQCAKYGIDTSQLHIHPEAPTSYTDVMTVRSSGRRTFFHQRGANALLGPEHFDFQGSSARIFHLGYLLLLDRLDQQTDEGGTVAGKILERATEAGFKTSIDIVSEDSHRFSEIVLPTLPQVDYCILNEFELGRTTEIKTRQNGYINLSAVRSAAEKLMEAGVRECVVVHFPEGACALEHDDKFAVQGSVKLPGERIVSTVGAGDAFAAGVLFGLHNKAPMNEVLLQGVTAAASCLFGSGTSDGILPMTHCLALGTQFGFKSLDC